MRIAIEVPDVGVTWWTLAELALLKGRPREEYLAAAEAKLLFGPRPRVSAYAASRRA